MVAPHFSPSSFVVLRWYQLLGPVFFLMLINGSQSVLDYVPAPHQRTGTISFICSKNTQLLKVIILEYSSH